MPQNAAAKACVAHKSPGLSVPLFDSDWANPNEFGMVMVVAPVASLAVPVAVMLVMPVIIIPVVIPMVLISDGC